VRRIVNDQIERPGKIQVGYHFEGPAVALVNVPIQFYLTINAPTLPVPPEIAAFTSARRIDSNEPGWMKVLVPKGDTASVVDSEFYDVGGGKTTKLIPEVRILFNLETLLVKHKAAIAKAPRRIRFGFKMKHKIA